MMLDTIQIIVHGTHGYFCFYNFARLSAPDPRSGAARSSQEQAAANGLCAMCAASDGHGVIH